MAAKKPIVLDSSGNLQQLQTGDFVDIPQGGTGATTAAGARTALGLQLGSNVQAWGAGLDALQALAATGLLVRTGANTFALRALTMPAQGLTGSNLDGVAGNPTLALANDLAALEGLAGTGLAVRTTTDTWAQRQLAVASTARLTVSNGDGVAGNPTLDLATLTDSGAGTFLKFTRDAYGRVSGSVAVVTADLTALLTGQYLSLGGGTLTGPLTLSGDPTLALHAATKQYVDANLQGLTPKPTATVATTAALAASTYANGTSGVGATLTLTATGTLTIDGYQVALNDLVLVKDESSGSHNGLYQCTTAGATGVQAVLTRHVDMDVASEIPGSFVPVGNAGTANKNSLWLCNTNNVTVGTTALAFTQLNGATDLVQGTGIGIAGNTISVNYTARLAANGSQLDLATVGGGGTGTKITFDVYGRVTGSASATYTDVGAQQASAELSALAGLALTGLPVRTGSGTYAVRSLVAPAAGLTISNADGVAGNPTFALANDLAGLEGLASTGIPVRTAADTWTQRQVAVASISRLTVTNGDGVAGNPTLDLASGIVTPGTYGNVTVDTYGRVTAGSAASTASPSNSTLTNNEASTTVAGSFVYTDGSGTYKKAIANAAGTSLPVGCVTADTTTGTAGTVTNGGEVTLTTAQWDTVTGQTGGLTSGVTYFLDNATAGHITSTAPASGYVVPVGQAESTTKLVVRVGQRVQL